MKKIFNYEYGNGWREVWTIVDGQTYVLSIIDAQGRETAKNFWGNIAISYWVRAARDFM